MDPSCRRTADNLSRRGKFGKLTFISTILFKLQNGGSELCAWRIGDVTTRNTLNIGFPRRFPTATLAASIFVKAPSLPSDFEGGPPVEEPRRQGFVHRPHQGGAGIVARHGLLVRQFSTLLATSSIAAKSMLLLTRTSPISRWFYWSCLRRWRFNPTQISVAAKPASTGTSNLSHGPRCPSAPGVVARYAASAAADNRRIRPRWKTITDAMSGCSRLWADSSGSHPPGRA